MSNSKKETEGFKTVDHRKSAGKKAQEPPAEPPVGAYCIRPPLPQQEAPTDNAQTQQPPPFMVSEVEPQQEPQVETEKPSEQIPAFDAYGALRWCIALLSAQAWQWMGLVADPTTGEVKKDLEQARLAIDSVAALVERLSPSVDADERREFQNLLSNLRLNFVNQSRPADRQ